MKDEFTDCDVSWKALCNASSRESCIWVRRRIEIILCLFLIIQNNYLFNIRDNFFRSINNLHFDINKAHQCARYHRSVIRYMASYKLRRHIKHELLLCCHKLIFLVLIMKALIILRYRLSKSFKGLSPKQNYKSF